MINKKINLYIKLELILVFILKLIFFQLEVINLKNMDVLSYCEDIRYPMLPLSFRVELHSIDPYVYLV